MLFLTSAVAGAVPGPFSLWDGGLARGFSGDSDVAGIVLGVFSRGGGGDTGSFSRVWGDAGAVLGLFFWDVGVTGGGVSAGGLSRTGGALQRAAAGLKARGADASC